MACGFDSSYDTTATTSVHYVRVVRSIRTISTLMVELSDSITEFAREVALLPPRSRQPFLATPVSAWHRRAEGQLRGGRPIAPLARGKLLRWPSLKERRQAWGLA